MVSVAAVRCRRKMGLYNKFVVFSHGQFSANRGYMETIEAMSIVKRAYPDIVLFLLGAGPTIPCLKELIQKIDSIIALDCP